MNGGKMNQITNQNELLIGRLGRDPELKYTAKQEPICFLSIAINQQDAPATWKKIIVWGKQAELCKLYLTKGKSVFVQGQKQNLIYAYLQNKMLRVMDTLLRYPLHI